jgi:predicted Zn-dependent protease
MNRRDALTFLAALAIAALLSGCAIVPLTGRSQLDLVSQSDLAQSGAESYAQVLAGAKLSKDATKLKLVADVGRRIAASAEGFMREQGLAADLQYYQWEFSLIQDDKNANAFCLPGGKIVVYTGILPVAGGAEGLSVVVAHEVAHTIANHSGERMSQLLLEQLGGMALGSALKQSPQKTQELAMLAYGVGADVGVLLPYGRRQESEADWIGLVLMARAGYNPEAAVRFWQRMATAYPTNMPEFLSTHPANATRIADIRKHVPEAMKYYHP